ncbi:hypothetical protein M0D21_01370 [Aquimarina sp. D1M17]|uniref:hypothetical protein n=1 Tax=Aquimarina acroporae TaxID=2937283 RepID=UPI0020BED3A1|nr:hypothetical protein [Aquimarina acroporae]MCK8520193.1 hypothetical protein [Aquimarina acroporae]
MMTTEKGVKEVIAQNSRFTFDEIELTDPIDKFISSFMADRLARELKRKFPRVNTTELTNVLFSRLRTIADIIAKVDSYTE